MKIGGLDFPRPILDALRDDRLVVFAGAGVSMGKPASLPSFKKLAMAIAQGTGEELKENEPEDRFLGRLKHKGVEVHKIAVEELKKNCYGEIPKPTDLHRDLLKLYPESMAPRIVTTNFDTLFEQAGECLFVSQTDVFTSPALPQGGHFAGIVHVHGVLSRPQDMVLTDADFGRAYLTEGWARRFLVDVFRSYAVLFVGYRHNDTIMNYLSRALPIDETKSRFALTHEPDESRWQYLGIEPITYGKSSDNDHGALYSGVNGLAKNTRRNILGWQREITEIAAAPPPLDEEKIDLIEDALRDANKTRFFTDAARSFEWVNWLEKRDHLTCLFGSSDLNERDVLLVEWIAEKFARAHSDELFLLIGRRYVQPHPTFWDELCRSVALKDTPPCDADTLSRWVSLLLVTAPDQFDKGYSLLWLGERCIKDRLWERVVDVFDAMSACRVVVKRGFSLPDADDEELSPRIDIELVFVSDHFAINKLWLEGLKPILNHISEPLLSAVVGQLATQHRNLSAWQEANRDWNSISHSRSAIEPHEQDKYPETIDVLIDAARDSLEWLASNCKEVAAQWSNRLASEDSPLLRRMAVHTLYFRKDLNSDEKIDWLLSNMDLNDFSTHHELFVLLKKTYANIDVSRRKAVLKAIQAHRVLSEELEVTERRTADYHFHWFHWLHTAIPECPYTKEALEDVKRRFPGIKSSEHPDLTHWISSGRGAHFSPWTATELLSQPAKNWVEKLVSFHQTDFNGPDRIGLNLAVSEAVDQDFQWGLDLAGALGGEGIWDTDIWNTLMRFWSGTELDEIRIRQVIHQLERTDLQKNCARPIAEFIYKLVTNVKIHHAHIPLAQVNQIAANLWRNGDRDDTRTETGSWLTAAINSTHGLLAGFWVNSINCWRRQQAEPPVGLNPSYRNGLEGIVEDTTLAGKLGRAVLARYLSFLLVVDRGWTEANLIPLFTRQANGDDYRALWNGLMYGPLSLQVAELMGDAFLTAVPHIMSDTSREEQRQFIRRYFTILANYTDDPIDIWIPTFFRHCDENARRDFAITIKNHLEDMDDSQQQEWWNRWLKTYWRNRLQGVPDRLYESEIGIMFCWLPDLQGVFPEAVNLAIQMQLEEFTGHSADSSRVVYMIEKGDLWQLHPDAVAQLLIHLGRIKSKSRAWPKGKELIEKLLKADLRCEMKRKLKELAVERCMT